MRRRPTVRRRPAGATPGRVLRAARQSTTGIWKTADARLIPRIARVAGSCPARRPCRAHHASTMIVRNPPCHPSQCGKSAIARRHRRYAKCSSRRLSNVSNGATPIASHSNIVKRSNFASRNPSGRRQCRAKHRGPCRSRNSSRRPSRHASLHHRRCARCRATNRARRHRRITIGVAAGRTSAAAATGGSVSRAAGQCCLWPRPR